MLRKVKDGNKNMKVLYAISAPSGNDGFSDSEEESQAAEEEEEEGEEEGEQEEEGVVDVPDPTEEAEDDDTSVNPEGDTICLAEVHFHLNYKKFLQFLNI